MKKTVIKGLSAMLAVVLTLTAAPLSGFVGLELPEWLDFSIMSKAAETSGTCGTNVTWEFDEETGTLTISGTGDMENRPSVISDSIKEVIIENGVTTISNNAFYNCESLGSVTIPDSVTSIGYGAFWDCSNLTNVKIPNSITTISDKTFYYCTSLRNVTIPDGVISIGEDAFRYCTSLKNVTISDNVTTIGNGAFSQCSNLTSIIIPDSVTSIGNGAFSQCSNLASVAISNGVTTIGDNAFNNCISLTEITIPDSVMTIGDGAFAICGGLSNITVNSDNQYYSNDEYGVLFNKDKTNLIQYPIGNIRTSYTIPNSVTTIGGCAFAWCSSLTKVTIPGSVTTIGGNAFEKCPKLASVTIPNSVTKIGGGAFSECNSLTKVTIPGSVTTIDGGTFYYCENLTSVTISNGVTIIGGSAFSICQSLTSVTIPDSVTTIGYRAFYFCKGLTSVTIPDGVKSIREDAFSYCNSLRSVIISNSVATIGDYAFYNCYSITDVYYSGTEEEWNEITINTGNDPLLNATIHFNYCEHNFVDGTCTDCGTNKPITQEMSSQIRFNRNADGSYAKTFDVRTRAMISDEDFKSLVGATDTEAIKNIDKIGFVYTINGENFSAESAQAVAQGETVSGYVDAPVKYIQDAGEYYMFTCLVTDIPAADRNYTLTAYAYICVNGKWYFSEEPMNADFNALYEKNYPIACEKYGWEV